MTSALRRRGTYLALAVATILIGLAVHYHANWLGPIPRDVIGDLLWGMMIAWLIGAAAPAASIWKRAVAAIAICFVVECSQLIDTAWLESLRATTLGHLMLGSSFDPRDLVVYAVGVAVAALLEAIFRRRALRTA